MSTGKEVIEPNLGLLKIYINICTLAFVFDAGISKYEIRDGAP
jgi:uncharacterized protein with von Willebrand factor type A (vWA) domain